MEDGEETQAGKTKAMIVKAVEIRDRGTYIAAMAIKMVPSTDAPTESHTNTSSSTSTSWRAGRLSMSNSSSAKPNSRRKVSTCNETNHRK